ncbi:glycoside hydrolase family 19 [Paucibacter sp. KBW04]|uniref:glycoside hydrolase family 19 protein n=1 Tax=Paucibacter sp. KBW04 TaxID=2153361 RepID=UPI000F55DF87|nr:glycoside hydrolase family 19 protein [Paucibacter sp. KBW04]RQO63158.1 glycoside hydrolase family 19 [Paucibacter sp. KBW04]
MPDVVISAEKLLKFAPRIRNPSLHAQALESARLASSVTTPRRLWHLMGQVFVETAGFTSFEEDLNYKTPQRLLEMFRAVRDLKDAEALIARGPEAIANRVYANRLGNGPEDSGDGWWYRGSGYLQLTGQDNFWAIGLAVGMPLVEKPDLARDPPTAAVVALRFWDSKRCSALADRDDSAGITRLINGPKMVGAKERRAATLRAMEVWLTQ